MLEINNKLGDIRFSRDVIVKIAEDSVEKTDGRAVLMNFKGKYKSLMPGTDAGPVTVHEDEDGAAIEIFIATRFGTSISDVSEVILSYVFNEVERVMCERPKLVRVVVTAVISKETAPRHLVFEKYGY